MAQPARSASPGYEDEFDFETTAEIDVPDQLIDQVIGQDKGREIIRLAAHQKRFVMLMGEPGTGKSMLGAALSELLPSGDLKDVIAYPNPEDPNVPHIEQVPAGEGEQRIEQAKQQQKHKETAMNFLFWLAIGAVAITTLYLAMSAETGGWYYYIGGMVGVGVLFYLRRFFSFQSDATVPKLLISNSDESSAPFVDATGAHEGALFGDVRHDPYQSGGSETPSHQLVEVGAIHRAHGGVLYIDEVSTLSPSTQQSLLTAIQEKEFPITGRSPGSSGSMVRTEPVPCDFVLVLAGNLEDLEAMHPALRSRIRGYGYEILTNHIIDDSEENHRKIARFVAQEVEKDGKIPHFSPDGVQMILREAHRRTDVEGKLTGRLRDLGGLVRAAGDVARKKGDDVVHGKHVQTALDKVKTVEEQLDEQQSDGARESSEFFQ
ncbi:MAG: ATP-binding protein [bacterium]